MATMYELEKRAIEMALSRPRTTADMCKYVADMRKLLPDRVFVMSYAYTQAKMFQCMINKRVTYLNKVEQLDTDRPTIVQIANYKEGLNYAELAEYIKKLDHVTVWTIRHYL